MLFEYIILDLNSKIKEPRTKKMNLNHIHIESVERRSALEPLRGLLFLKS